MVFTRYSPSLEHIHDGEEKVFDEIAETFIHMAEQVEAREGHATRPSHAKSTGLLKGRLEIAPDLPPELAQGLAATPAGYEVLVRLAQGPGEHLDDKVSTHRGLSLKILGVDGPRLSQAPEPATQDWLLETTETSFITRNAPDFLLNLKAGVGQAPKMPEGLKAAVSSAAETAHGALKAMGFDSRTLGFFGHPPTHPLSEAYFSQTPIRWGDYVAKIAVRPTPETLAALPPGELDPKSDPDVFRTAVVDHFARHGAAFDLTVQLMTNPDDMSIEDATTRWSEDDSPYRPVARLTLPPQDAWSPARSEAVDERASFNPANSLEAHRPLGQIMRARIHVYQRVADWRRRRNGAQNLEPHTLAAVPD